MVCQFLSRRYHVWTDKYGGDWESRIRFVNEVIDRVSGATSGPVVLHLFLTKLEYGGYEPEDVPEFLSLLKGVTAGRPLIVSRDITYSYLCI